MKNILLILNSEYTITRENYKKLKKILFPDILEQKILDNLLLIDYIMLKDFESEYDRRDFIQKLFKSDEVSDGVKLNIYLKMLSLGIQSCFIKPNRDYDDNFRTVAYLKLGNHFNKSVFKESEELALMFSKFVPFLANKRQKGVDAKRKTIAKTIMLNGLVSENYEQVINPDSSKRGIEDIVKYLVQSENYGTIIKIFEDKIFEVNEENYQLIINAFIKESQKERSGYEIRYNQEQVKIFFNQLLDVIEDNLNKNRIKQNSKHKI